MSEHDPARTAGGQHDGADSGADGFAASRRRFLKAASAGVVATGIGAAATGSTTARGIETPRLTRDGNLLRDPSDRKVVLRGVNVVDPARADTAHWRRPVEETVEHATDPDRDWYARIVRVPCAPGEIAGGSEDGEPGVLDQASLEDFLANLLDPVVEKCAEVGAYCIVDYHRHQTDDYTQQALHDEVTMFWETVAPRYAGDPHVLYEVYNEPIGPYAGDCQSCEFDLLNDTEAAQDTWTTWKETAQPWVDTIREHAPQNVVVIGSPRWSQWTYWAPHDEFAGDNLAYAAHVYTHENLRPLADYFGTPSEDVPVFLSEFGYQNQRHDGSQVPEFLAGTTSEEGQEFRDFLETYDSIHWQVWCFDHSWSPPMFDFDDATHEWSLMGGEDWQGEFFRDYLAERRADDVPGGAPLTGTTPTPAGTPTPGGTPTPDTPTPDTPTPTPGDGCPEGEDAPEPVQGVYPQDLDGDGLHRDVNANCRLDSDDVVTYFENMEDPAITANVGAYDYNDNGRIDFDDLVTLFESL